MRLNGWMRIGVVLSVVWMAAGTAYWWNDESSRNIGLAKALDWSQNVCITNNVNARAKGQPEHQSVSGAQLQAAYQRQASIGIVAFIAAIWLVLGWLGIGLTYAAVRWIMKGFGSP